MRLLLLTLLISGCSSQQAYLLRWHKFDVGTSTYRATLQNAVPDRYKLKYDSFDLRNNLERQAQVVKSIKGISISPQYLPLLTKLEQVDKDRIDVSVVSTSVAYELEAESEFEKNRRAALKNMEGMLQLKSLIRSNGRIESYYLKQAQKNLLSLLFSLPDRKVSIGDHWSIPVNFIELGNGFVVSELDRINQVTLKAIYRDAEYGLVAEIFYILGEKISGNFNLFPEKKQETPPFTVKFSYIAMGEFVLEHGIWKKFAGQLSLTGSGHLSIDNHQLHYLTYVPELIE